MGSPPLFPSGCGWHATANSVADKKTFTVSVHLKLTEQPIDHEAVNAYQKGEFYCIYLANEKVVKYPMRDIWRVVEGYGRHDSR